MSRLSSSAITVKPSPNIYTGLAFVSMFATLGAMAYVIYMYMQLTK